MNATPINIAILITCHNRRQKTLACLSALFAAELPANHSLHVFLVDDGSTDGTSEAVKNAFPTVNIIQGNGQLFWNRGMHLAWETAAKANEFDYYVWLNDDTLLLKEALQILIADATSKHNNSIICGTTLSQQSLAYTYGGRLISGVRVLPNIILNECEYINGNCVLVPKQVFNAVGMLDPIFPHAIGDFEYGLRAKKHGIKLYVASGAVGYCEPNSQPPQWCLSKNTLIKRIKNLYSPLGNSHPYYFFIFEKRYFGIITALKHLITIHVRVLIPRLWKHQL